MASQREMPDQSLNKVLLLERLAMERKHVFTVSEGNHPYIFKNKHKKDGGRKGTRKKLQ
jgi:hypothetical protein